LVECNQVFKQSLSNLRKQITTAERKAVNEHKPLIPHKEVASEDIALRLPDEKRAIYNENRNYD